MKMSKNVFVIIGRQDNGYTRLNLENGIVDTVSNIDEKSFNEHKFLEFKYKLPVKPIISIVAEVTQDFDSTEMLGYLISDEYGNLDLYTSDMLIKNLDKFYLMNYSTFKKGNSLYLRRNVNVIINSITNQEVKDLIGYNFNSFTLKTVMSLLELNICMLKNDFKLGYSEVFTTNTYSKDESVKAFYRIYYNKEGHQIILSGVESLDAKRAGIEYYDLNWYGQKLIMMSHIIHDKYINYIKNNNYDMGSTCPVDGVKTDILIQQNTHIYKFLNISKNAKKYSTPCIPYYLSKDLDGALYMLNISPRQSNWIKQQEDIRKNKGKSSSSFGLLCHFLIGFDNIKRYHEGLNKFYKNYIISEKEVLDMIYNSREKFLDISKKEATKIWQELKQLELQGVL